MNLSFIFFLFSSLCFGLNPSSSSTQSGNFFETYAAYTDLSKSQKQYNESSKSRIEALLSSIDDGGTAVVLGPGPCNDLPVKHLLTKFDRVVFIDMYTAPVRDLVHKIVTANPALKNKAEIVTHDLSGGVSALLETNKRDFKEAMLRDLELGMDWADSHYDQVPQTNQIIEQHLKPVDLSHYRPKILISTLVTSQVLATSENLLNAFIRSLRDDRQACEATNKKAMALVKQALTGGENVHAVHKKFQEGHYSTQTMTSLMNSIKFNLLAQVSNIYFPAMSASNAQYIFYSNDSPLESGFEQEKLVFQNEFLDRLAASYTALSSEKNVMPYKHHKNPVSFYSFAQVVSEPQPASHCYQCGAVPAKLLKCSRCNKARYCGKECQGAHWKCHRECCNN